MRIYGKPLPEILAEMPWQFKIIVMVGMIWIPFSLIHATYIFATLGRVINKPGIVDFTGNPMNAGVSDPSMAPTADGRGVYMAFTIIHRYDDVYDKKNGRWSPGVRLAQSHAPCKMWSDLGDITPSAQEQVVGPDGINALFPDKPLGTWWVEQPALLYDPGDPGKEYKVYYYRYLWVGPEEKSKQWTRLYGMIGYRSSHDPQTRQWSTEQWVFGAKAKTDSFHGNPPDPYNSLVQYHLDDFDPSLKDIWFYARPSVAVYQGVYYMTLSAFTQTDNLPDRVIMLASADHGQTWHFVGTLLSREDAPKMGPYTKMGGGTLIEKQGKLYFVAVLGDDKVIGLGSFVIPFDDPSKALLVKDKKTGAPEIINHVGRVSVQPSEIGGGYAAFSDVCTGLYVSEFSGLKDNIHIFSTRVDPVKE